MQVFAMIIIMIVIKNMAYHVLLVSVVCKMLGRDGVGGGCCINWTRPVFAEHMSHVAMDIRGSTLFLAIQQVFKGTLELCIMSLDLSPSHCSEIGFCRVETCGLLARQLVQSRDISRLRELAFVNWVTALIKTCLFVCVLFWVLTDIRPP